MKLKTLVSTMAVLGVMGSAAIAAPATMSSAQVPVMYGTDSVWNSVIERNQDNASGVVALQAGQTKVTGEVIPQAQYVSRQSGTNTFAAYSGNLSGSYGISLYDAELYVDSQLSSWVRAHIAMDYGTNFLTPTTASSTGAFSSTSSMFFPEAYVTFYNGGNLFGKAGRMYLNFGSTTHDSVTTPLPEVLSEINETAAEVGFLNVAGGLYGDIAVYNGNAYGTGTTATNSSNQAHGYVAELGYTQAMGSQGYNAYVDYTGNILDGLSFNYAPSIAGSTTPTEQIPGLAVHADAHTGPFSVMANYVTALAKIGGSNWLATNQLYYDGKPAQPSAYSVEGDYGFNVMNYTATLTLGYQGSQQAAGIVPVGFAFPIPATRALVAYGVALSRNVNVGVEYDYDTDYGTSTTAGNATTNFYTGTGNTNSTVTARLNVLF
jgi:hypothetical protein